MWEAPHSPYRRLEMTRMPLGAHRMLQDAFFGKSRANTLGLPKTRNRALLGHPRRYGCEMGLCGVLECGMVGCRPSRRGEVSLDVGCGDAPSPISRKKKSGLHPNASASAFFYLSTFPTKSNPDMRNSKLAHTQAGF